MPLLRAKELIEIINKAEISHALCDKRLEAELMLALPSCPSLKSIRYWYDDATDALMQKQSIEFKNVDTSAEDVAVIAFTPANSQAGSTYTVRKAGSGSQVIWRRPGNVGGLDWLDGEAHTRADRCGNS